MSKSKPKTFIQQSSYLLVRHGAKQSDSRSGRKPLNVGSMSTKSEVSEYTTRTLSDDANTQDYHFLPIIALLELW